MGLVSSNLEGTWLRYFDPEVPSQSAHLSISHARQRYHSATHGMTRYLPGIELEVAGQQTPCHSFHIHWRIILITLITCSHLLNTNHHNSQLTHSHAPTTYITHGHLLSQTTRLCTQPASIHLSTSITYCFKCPIYIDIDIDIDIYIYITYICLQVFHKSSSPFKSSKSFKSLTLEQYFVQLC